MKAALAEKSARSLQCLQSRPEHMADRKQIPLHSHESSRREREDADLRRMQQAMVHAHLLAASLVG